MSKLDLFKVGILMNTESKCLDAVEAASLHRESIKLMFSLMDPRRGELI